MKRKHFSVEQIVAVLKQAELGMPVADILRQVGISEQTFYRWKKHYAGLQLDRVRELKQLQDENARLKRLVAELSLDKAILQDIAAKSGAARAEARSGERHRQSLRLEASPGLYAAPGRMDGHKVVGYVGLYAKRVNSFHEEVAQRFGLCKPRPKVKMTSVQRRRLADQIIDRLMADGLISTPAYVKAMHSRFAIDPLPLAESKGLSVHDATPREPQPTAYAVAVDSVQAPPDGATALLCNAIPISASTNDAEIGRADAVEAALTAPAASSSIVLAQKCLRETVIVLCGATSE